MATEQSVGIAAYVSPTLPGFTAILRHRFTDFKVNEVGIDGKIVELTDVSIPGATLQKHTSETIPDTRDVPQSVEAVVAAYQILVGPSKASKAPELAAFLEKALAWKQDPTSTPKPPKSAQLDPVEDKDQRRALHGLFKGLSWLPPLTSETVDGSNVIELRVDTRGGRGGGNKRKRDREEWPGGDARYVRFALYKENMDTHTALSTITRLLHMNHKVLSVAGTKDKRAVTVQWATAYKVLPDKLARVNQCGVRGLRLGNYSYVQEQLRLGDLDGNRFKIVLRGIDCSNSEAAATAAAALRTHGFVNYFGLQRFGSSTSSTHMVGSALLRGEWDEAIRHIMSPSASTHPEVSRALSDFLSGADPADVLPNIPRNLVAERAVLSVLAKEGRKALVNALMVIPRNLRTMYTHAYQSCLWNNAASFRISRYGSDKVVAGDLIIAREDMRAARRAKIAPLQATKDGSPGKAAEIDGEIQTEDVEEEVYAQSLTSIEPHIVTETEAAAGMYTIEDVVLPLPGERVTYPANDVAAVYREIAARDGVDLDRSMHNVKEFSQTQLPGTYRHVLFKPTDLDCQLVRYDEKDADLNEDEGFLEDRRGVTTGKYLALRLCFTLPPSTYATMLIRELTKMPTTVEFSRSLRHPD